MSAAEQFYTSGGTLGRLARSYVTRRADGELLDYLLRGDFCYVLTSRQMGKSSLMVRTAASLRARAVNVAILDLTRIGQNVSIEQWYGGLLTRLGSELDLEDELDDYWISEQASRQGPMQRFMSALREVIFPALQGQLVIFIDEIDAVRSLPFSSDEFFAGIRECYNSRVTEPQFNRITFCLLGVAQPSDLISNVYITPFNIGHRVELTDFSEEEARPLLEGMRGKTVKPAGEHAVLHRILHWTGGHPYLTQKLCETVTQLTEEIKPTDADAVCKELFLSSRSREQQDNLIFVRDRVLASHEHRAAILDLYEKVLRGRKIRDDDSNATINPLRLSGLLVVSGGFLRVRNRIYATVFDKRWIVANMPDAELRRQKAAYRRGVLKTVAISVPICLCMIALGAMAIYQVRKATRSYYLATTAVAQQAFNTGDYSSGRSILRKWMTEGGRRAAPKHQGSKSNCSAQPEGVLVRIEHYIEGREDLEHTFAMGLLEEECKEADSLETTIPSQERAQSDPIKSTGCAAETAIATTSYGQHDPAKQVRLIAVAGTDSSVQIWRMDADGEGQSANSKTLTKFRNLQLESGPDGQIALARLDAPLDPCPDPKKPSANHWPGITSLSFSPDGHKLAISTGTWRDRRSPGYILVWDISNPTSPDGLTVLNRDGTASPFASGPSSTSTFSETADSVNWAKTPEGRVFLGASSEDATARLWEFRGDSSTPRSVIDPRGSNLASDPNGLKPVDGGIGKGANVIVLSSAKEHLAAIGYGDGHLLLYNLLGPYDKPLYAGIIHVSGIMSMVFLEQKGHLRLVVGSRDGEMLVLDPQELVRTSHAINASASRDKPSAADPEIDSSESPTLDALKLTLASNQGVIQGLAAAYDTDDPNNTDKSKAWLLTSGSNGTVDLWTVVPDFHLVQTFTGASEGVHAAAFCPGRFSCVVSASSDYNARLWQYPYQQNSDHSHILPNGLGLHFPGQTLGAVFLPAPDSAPRLVTAVGESRPDRQQDRGTIAIWSPSDNAYQELHVREKDQSVELLGFNISPDGNLIAATSRSRNLYLVDRSSGEQQSLPVYATLGAKIRIRCLNADGNSILPLPDAHEQITPCRQYLIAGVADTADISSLVHPAARGLCMWRVRDNGRGANPRWSYDPTNLCGERTRDSKSTCPAKLTDLIRAARCVGAFDISDEGDEIAIGRDSEDGNTRVEVWDSSKLLGSGKLVSRTYKNGFTSRLTDLSFSYDAKYLAAATIDSRLYYWRVTDKKDFSIDDAERLTSRGQVLAFSPQTYGGFPQKSVLAVGLQDSGIILFDRWTGDGKANRLNKLMDIRRHHGGILGLAFSPDGNLLASTGNDGLVTLLRAH